MNLDQSWDLLRLICESANNNVDFAETIKVVEPQLNDLDGCHFEALIESVELEPEFVAQHKEFLNKLLAALEAKKPTFSFRPGFRYSLLEVMLKEESPAEGSNEWVLKHYPVQDDFWPSRRWKADGSDYRDLSGYTETETEL